MKAWRQPLFCLLVLLVVLGPLYSKSKSASERGTLSRELETGSCLRSSARDMTGMWLGTWKSSIHPGTTGRVKAVIHQVNQRVEARVELEGTASGNVVIHASGTFIGRILVVSGEHSGRICLIQGWLRKKALSGFFLVRDPDGRRYDWGRFHVKLLERPEGFIYV